MQIHISHGVEMQITSTSNSRVKSRVNTQQQQQSRNIDLVTVFPFQIHSLSCVCVLSLVLSVVSCCLSLHLIPFSHTPDSFGVHHFHQSPHPPHTTTTTPSILHSTQPNPWESFPTFIQSYVHFLQLLNFPSMYLLQISHLPQ